MPHGKWPHRACLIAATLVALPALLTPAPLFARETGASTTADARTPASSLALDRADFGKLFDRVVSRLHDRYFDPDQLQREGWVERANALRASVAEAETATEVVARINGLLDTLKASHLRLHTPDDLTWYVLLDLSPRAPGARELIAERFWGNRPYYAGIGAFTAEIGGRHIVDGLLDGSPAARAGLRVGDEIVEVDGAPYSQIAAFRGKVGRSAVLSIRRSPDAAPAPLPVEVAAIVPGLAFEQATIDSARVIERDGRRIGYFHVWSLMDRRPLLQAMARLTPGGRLSWTSRDRHGNSTDTLTSNDQIPVTSTPLDAIVVDMRCKVGGTDMSQMLLDLLQPSGRAASFDYRGRDARGTQRLPPAQPNPPFRGRAALLIDHHTRSACEMVSHSFRFAGMGPVIGTTTAGHVLASQIEVMPGGLVLQMPVARPEGADGLILEGRGVVPDIPVERPLPYSAGADPVLDAALQSLTRR